MNFFQMTLKVIIALEGLRANAALKGFDVTNFMNSSHVTMHFVFLHKLPAANLALVPGVRMLGSRRSAAALSMRRVVVSADR